MNFKLNNIMKMKKLEELISDLNKINRYDIYSYAVNDFDGLYAENEWYRDSDGLWIKYEDLAKILSKYDDSSL